MGDPTVKSAIINVLAAVTGGSIALFGVWLQTILTNKFSKKQSLIEAKRIAFAKLLSANMSEAPYPNFISSFTIDSNEDVNKYNERVEMWRTNRRNLKGLAAEALLFSEGKPLKKKLREFIENYNPDIKLNNLEELMRKEISLD